MPSRAYASCGISLFARICPSLRCVDAYLMLQNVEEMVGIQRATTYSALCKWAKVDQAIAFCVTHRRRKVRTPQDRVAVNDGSE